MAEWLVEAGIGETRAALIDAGAIVEIAIERADPDALRAGTIIAGRLTRKADPSGRGLVTIDGGAVVQLTPVPAALTQGAAVLVEITREALPEGSGTKPARARVAPAGAVPAPGPDLLARLDASGLAVRRCGDRDDGLEAHGWSEAIEDATCGIVARPDAMLRIALTPAMTLIDVDGSGTAAELAIAGARLAGQTIRRFGIAGSIGIDLPTLAGKAERLAAAAALDAALPPPFERTAVNGFGFLQIVRRRVRASVMEVIAADPVLAAAMALLRQAERARGHGAVTLDAAPAVVARIAAHPAWIAALQARIGAAVVLRDDARLAISAGHARRAQT